mgnify:FL=1
MPQTGHSSLAVLGGGAWGTALALQLARRGHRVALWVRSEAHAEAIQQARCNARYLPDIDLPEGIEATADLDAALASAEQVLVATPSHAFRPTLEQIVPILPATVGLAWACKGFEPNTGRFLHEVAQSVAGERRPMALISGPSFAHEVARGLPTAVTVAANDPKFGALWASLLHGEAFRAYYTDDLVGAELGGALKNVIAVACGLADGLGLGLNTRAALITRGLAEMIRLGDALGAQTKTLIGLAGVGDLVLTCTGDLSRNRRFGLMVGEGRSADEALAEIGQVVEGVNTAEEAMRLAERCGVEMPITEQVFGIIHRGWSPAKGVKVLLERDQKPE